MMLGLASWSGSLARFKSFVLQAFEVVSSKQHQLPIADAKLDALSACITSASTDSDPSTRSFVAHLHHVFLWKRQEMMGRRTLSLALLYN